MGIKLRERCPRFSRQDIRQKSNYVNNDFITWMNISAAKTNTKGLYEKILKCTYSSSELTAIKKLNRVPLLGTLNEKRICSAMQKISKAVNTARSIRASIEFCLGAFRSNIEISAFTETKQQTCFCCGILEKHKSINETGRNPIFHLLFDGAPAEQYQTSPLKRNKKGTF